MKEPVPLEDTPMGNKGVRLWMRFTGESEAWYDDQFLFVRRLCTGDTEPVDMDGIVAWRPAAVGPT